MIQLIISNLTLVGIFTVLLLMSWASNLFVSLWYNIGKAGELFDWKRFFNGVLKILSLCVGIALFTITVTTFPEALKLAGLEMPKEYIDVFNIATIIGVFVIKGIIPYLKQTITTINQILDDTMKAKAK